MRLVYGVGINDKNGFSSTKEYKLWVDMLRRCYTDNPIRKQISYQECTVSDNFKSFSYFYDWCQEQIGFNVCGFQLDKDLLIKGNKLYSEERCLFLPGKLNGALEKCKGLRGSFPIGVYFEKRTGLIKANVRVDGKQIHLGSFDNKIDAFNEYKKEKEIYIKYLASFYSEQIDERAYKALMNYTVDITD